MKSRRDEQVEFQEEYTTTMTQWASLEDGLMHAFCPIFGEKQFLARSLFYAQQGMRSKLVLTDAAYTAFAHSTSIYTLWNMVSRRLARVIQHRNNLTHGQHLGYFDREYGRNETIVTQIWSVANRIKGKAYEYDLPALVRVRQQSAKIRTELEALGQLIATYTLPHIGRMGMYDLPDALKILSLDNVPDLTLTEHGILGRSDVV